MKVRLYIIFGIVLFINLSVVAQENIAWKLTREFSGGPKTGIAILGDSLLLVSLKNGVIKSNDYGNTFQTALKSDETYSIFISKEGYIYVGGRGKVYKSSDGGMVWDAIELATKLPVIQFVEDTNYGLFAITRDFNENYEYLGDGVFFSSDKGVTWEKRNNGLNNFTVCERIAIDKYGRLYLAVADELITGHGGLFVSDNSGISWHHVAVKIDGQAVINDQPKIKYTNGLSISENDTVYLSFEGSAGGFVSLNLKISINDLKENNNWIIYRANDLNTWYMDTSLQNQFFTFDGSVFSSSIGTIGLGKTYVKYKDDKSWKKFDNGLGVGEFGFREPQHFVEVDDKILMVQEYDERIYWLPHTSGAVPSKDVKVTEFKLWPNPVMPGNEVFITGMNDYEVLNATLYSSSGQIISNFNDFTPGKGISVPRQSGLYLISVNYSGHVFTQKLIVR